MPQPLNGELIPPGQPAPTPVLKPKPKTDADTIIEELGPEHGPTALEICERLSSEPDSLEAIAAQTTGKSGNTAARAFFRWRLRSPALCRLYARACGSRAHVLAQRMMDMIEQEECPHKARVKMDALKWIAAKFNRTDFGDEPQHGVSVTINNDAGASNALEEIRQRLQRKRKSMLSQPGGGVEEGGTGGGEAANRPPALPSRA